MRAHYQREDGFTLVELLVVIIIIGILAAIAVPIFLNQRQRANDATLKTDLKNVATMLANSGKTNAELMTLFGAQTSVIADAEAAIVSSPAEWNAAPGLDRINVSPATVVEIVMIQSPTVTWENKHNDGGFCLAGTHKGSNYDYVPGAGNPADYDKHLFYDVQLGGVVDMIQLADAYKDGKLVSCSGMAKRWIDITGY